MTSETVSSIGGVMSKPLGSPSGDFVGVYQIRCHVGGLHVSWPPLIYSWR